MRALLLAGGLGARLRPLTELLPKCLAPVRGRPLIEYWLHALGNASFERILVNTHYHAELVEQMLRASPFSARIEIVREENLLGTGGTMLRNRTFFAGAPFLVAHADNLSDFVPQDLVRTHNSRPRGSEATMVTFGTDDPASCGIVVADTGGIVREFHEKVATPPGNVANAAVYMFEPSVFGLLESVGNNVIDLSTEIIPKLLGRISCFHHRGYHRDIGTLANWRQTNWDSPLPVPPSGVPDAWQALLDRDDGRLRRHVERLLAA